MNGQNARNREIERIFEKKFVGRFYAELDNAKEAAHLLFSKLGIKQAVYVFTVTYGEITKHVEYSVRLLSEGVRPDSSAIIYTVTK